MARRSNCLFCTEFPCISSEWFFKVYSWHRWPRFEKNVFGHDCSVFDELSKPVQLEINFTY